MPSPHPTQERHTVGDGPWAAVSPVAPRRAGLVVAGRAGPGRRARVLSWREKSLCVSSERGPDKLPCASSLFPSYLFTQSECVRRSLDSARPP